jgi:hypothetical protein
MQHPFLQVDFLATFDSKPENFDDAHAHIWSSGFNNKELVPLSAVGKPSKHAPHVSYAAR